MEKKYKEFGKRKKEYYVVGRVRIYNKRIIKNR